MHGHHRDGFVWTPRQLLIRGQTPQVVAGYRRELGTPQHLAFGMLVLAYAQTPHPGCARDSEHGSCACKARRMFPRTPGPERGCADLEEEKGSGMHLQCHGAFPITSPALGRNTSRRGAAAFFLAQEEEAAAAAGP